MKFNLITLFPQFFDSPLQCGVVAQAIKKELIQTEYVNPRSFTHDVHHTVDDKPFGDGDGMVMKAEPLRDSIEFLKNKGSLGLTVYLSPQGKKWDDQMAREWSKNYNSITLICGRYAGVDQRFINKYVDCEVSVGDYILSGGEIGALAIIDSVARFLPGVLGNNLSKDAETFVDDVLESPLYTRPRVFEGQSVPEILLSGHHQNIQKWRQKISLLKTYLNRPDLLKQKYTSYDFEELKNWYKHLPLEEQQSLGIDLKNEDGVSRS